MLRISTHIDKPIHTDEDLYLHIEPILKDLSLPPYKFQNKYAQFEIPQMLLNMRFARHKHRSFLHLLVKYAAHTPDSSINATTVMKVILANGALANITDYKGRTPLHLAAALHEPGSLHVLLNNNADPNACDHRGVSVIDYARESATLVRESSDSPNGTLMTLKHHGAKIKKEKSLPNKNDSTSTEDISEMQIRIESLELQVHRLTAMVEKLLMTQDKDMNQSKASTTPERGPRLY